MDRMQQQQQQQQQPPQHHYHQQQQHQQAPPYLTLVSNSRAPRGGDGASMSSADSTYGTNSVDASTPSATHDISRVSYHVKHLDSFAKTLEDSASRAFPNRGRPSMQRYSQVQCLLLHWKSDDLFVLPELEDLEQCMRVDYNWRTDIFPIPSENSHLELMLKIGAMIKEHESTDTLFIVYYGGHARIDESRQSTWCATRHSGSPWLQWSAIQTLLERSVSDVLILLDCCAGAASATFPNGKSITETISASSWDAIAPDPGRYSFTNALIEVMQQWRMRPYSAAMLHAEVLARLKHPRPVTINGKHFEARSTPVHFMMTSNHRAPSIELGHIFPNSRRPSDFQEESSSAASSAATTAVPPSMASGHSLTPPPTSSLIPPHQPAAVMAGGRGGPEEVGSEPDEDTPHVMISLALEDNQQLDLNAWEQWLSGFPALAKYVKVQGVFKSHSTLLLLSLPVMVWDLLPEDPACSFVAFIRSNNLIKKPESLESPVENPVVGTVGGVNVSDGFEEVSDDHASIFSGTTYTPGADDAQSTIAGHRFSLDHRSSLPPAANSRNSLRQGGNMATTTDTSQTRPSWMSQQRQQQQNQPLPPTPTQPQRPPPGAYTPNRPPALSRVSTGNTVATTSTNDKWDDVRRTMILNNSRSSRRTATYSPEDDVPDGPPLAAHVVARLEEYFQNNPEPNTAVAEFLASNLGVESRDVHLWFHHRRQQERMTYNLQNLSLNDQPPPDDTMATLLRPGGGPGPSDVTYAAGDGPRMILPGHLERLLEIFPSQVLLVDLRPRADFERSHIHRAVNLRAHVDFVRYSTFEMAEAAFADEESRRGFSKWYSSRCVVFYDRVVEFPWECPVASALLDKFKRKGWSGRCFVLKGHYREFSASYEKYILGRVVSQQAKDYLASLEQTPPATAEEAASTQEQYLDWLSLVENEDRVPSANLNPAKRRERMDAIEENQRNLEAEFRARFPSLYKKFLALQPPPVSHDHDHPPPHKDWDSKKGVDTFDSPKTAAVAAHLVAPLVRGLEKMHEAGLAAGHSHPHSPPPQGSGVGKAAAMASGGGSGIGGASSSGGGSGGGEEGGSTLKEAGVGVGGKSEYVDKYGERASADGFDEIDPRDEALRNDPAFQNAGGSGDGSIGPGGLGRGGAVPVDGKGGRTTGTGRTQATSLWKRLRSGAGK